MSKPPPLTWGIIQTPTLAGDSYLPANSRESLEIAYMQAVPGPGGLGHVWQHLHVPSFVRRLF